MMARRAGLGCARLDRARGWVNLSKAQAARRRNAALRREAKAQAEQLAAQQPAAELEAIIAPQPIVITIPRPRDTSHDQDLATILNRTYAAQNNPSVLIKHSRLIDPS